MGFAIQGRSSPLGATVVPEGVNFSVYSKSATSVDLLFYDDESDPTPARIVSLDPKINRTHHYWHTFVPGIRPGQLYAYRVNGPCDPAKGMRFDPSKVLLDPYARCIGVPENYSREAASRQGDNSATAMKGMVWDPHAYDWDGDAPLCRPYSRTIIYEMHVRGFTRHPNSGLCEKTRGTYAGLIEKIPYLRQLGISAVELLPIFQFDARDAPPGQINYWGYSPVSFFAVHRGYSSARNPLGSIDEFRGMVKAFHQAGIEIILDVVFNHTAEGDHRGPTLSFRGFENGDYYILETDRSRYANFSGTGNTLNTNHPVVRRMIVDSLRYWVGEMHVDGFRFDLASILERDESGKPILKPPVLWDIESDPALAGTKLIAEAWDAAGLYDVGRFAVESWREWNGRFRDEVRSFFRGDNGTVQAFADRLTGSPQIYSHKEQDADESVNFVTSHDGFTLNDLVTYNHKHNEANGEQGRDGTNDNRSWNCGVEGPSNDPVIERLRNRQVKNMLATTLLSLGLPMISMGDEVRRTQLGNNNAYCQDNETSWFDWSLLAKHADVRRFFAILAQGKHWYEADEIDQLTLIQFLRNAKRSWHGIKLGQPDWSASSHSLALTVEPTHKNLRFHIMFNAFWEPLDFELPPAGGQTGTSWRRWVDTSLESPDDIVEIHAAPIVPGPVYRAGPRSVAACFARLQGGN